MRCCPGERGRVVTGLLLHDEGDRVPGEAAREALDQLLVQVDGAGRDALVVGWAQHLSVAVQAGDGDAVVEQYPLEVRLVGHAPSSLSGAPIIAQADGVSHPPTAAS